jgi:hypothetical protein
MLAWNEVSHLKYDVREVEVLITMRVTIHRPGWPLTIQFRGHLELLVVDESIHLGSG